MSKCISCENFALQGSPLAKSGWGYCSHEKTVGTYYSSLYGRDCDKFTQIDEKQELARIDWLKKQ